MSDTKIQFNFAVGAVPTDVTSAALSDPTGTFGVRRLDTLAVVVADGTALTHDGVGEYSYTFADPASGLTYNYWVEFVYAGNTYRIEQDISGGTGGGGAGTTVAAAYPSSCISLPRYAEIMELNENHFWGLNDGESDGTCDHIWNEKERKRIARYLSEAQEEIEQVTGYPLCPTYFLNERHTYAYPFHTKWGKVLQVGHNDESDISTGAAVNYATDPAVVGPIATTVTDEDEIRVYYPGSSRRIIPESVTIAGGNVTITIPWCRLVDPANFNNPATGLDYTDTTIYTTTVDVLRNYHDDSIQGGVIWSHRDTALCTCGCSSCCGTCDEYAVNACAYIRNAETGAIDLLPASHATGAWVASCSTCYCSTPDLIEVHYQAGLDPMTSQAEDAIIRLANAKMPTPPCGCGLIQEMWTRDRAVPDVNTAERLNNPFGLNDGAWVAWRFANAMKLQKGFALG